MSILNYRILNLNSKYTQNIVYSNKHKSEIPCPLIKTLVDTLKNKFGWYNGTSRHFYLDSKKQIFEQYMDAAKADVMNFLEELGLSDTLALQVLEDVRASIS